MWCSSIQFLYSQAKNRTEHMSLHLRQLTHDMALTHETLDTLKNKVALNQKQTAEVVGSLREDMVQHQTQTLELLTACQKHIMKNGQELFDSLHENIAIMKNEMKAMKEMMLQTTSVRGHDQEKK